jgi:hypothetical protein
MSKEKATMDALLCPSCNSTKIKLNGHIHNGKQNHQCKDCGRQFVLSPTKKYISQEEKEKINLLLLERISLAGICRVMGVSEPWLLDYVSGLYAQLPDDLWAELPTKEQMQAYLEDNFDRVVYELLPLKKKLLRLSQRYHVQPLSHLHRS